MSHKNSYSTCKPITRDEIEARVIPILAERAGMPPEQLHDAQRLIEDLGYDSLEMIEASMEIEEEFDIDVPDDALERMKTVGDVLKEMTEVLG